MKLKIHYGLGRTDPNELVKENGQELLTDDMQYIVEAVNSYESLKQENAKLKEALQLAKDNLKFVLEKDGYLSTKETLNKIEELLK